jgi:sugar phosphate permease
MANKSSHPVNGLLKFCGIGSLIAAPVLAISFLVADKYIFLFLAAVAELLIFASLAPINTVLVLSAPKKLVTMTQGITILLINVFGAFVGPQLVGGIADNINLATGLQVTTIAMILCSVFWLYGSNLSPLDTANET